MPWARSTYFLTASTYERRNLLQSSRLARLFIQCMLGHRDQGRLAVHAFVVMPDHVHVLLTPAPNITLERAAQFVKGTFSFRAKKDAGFRSELWAHSYYDERMRSASQTNSVLAYIERNPVVRGLARTPMEFPHGSACGEWKLDPLPEWLSSNASAAEAALYRSPFSAS